MNALTWVLLTIWLLAVLGVAAAKLGLLSIRLGPKTKPRKPKEPTDA